MNHTPDYKSLIPEALSGDMNALERILLSVRDQVYNLALRFLWHPQEAEDATQEILVKIMLHLNQFEFRSAFTTWTYRIATNYLIDTKKSLLERSNISFDEVSREIRASASLANETSGISRDSQDSAEQIRETARDVQTACTHAMLQCLERRNRAAFILGEVFNMHSQDASTILGISADAYRQRLSRARATMESFLENHCGVMDPENPCRCEKRACQLQSSRTLQKYLYHARKLEKHEPEDVASSNTQLGKMALLYRSNRSYIPRFQMLERIKRSLQATEFWSN